MNRKALVVGIDDYNNEELNLSCCVNDANKISDLLEFNADKSRNFSIYKLLNSDATYDNIILGIEKVFTDDSDIGILFFSGHGADDKKDGRIVTCDYPKQHNGIRFRDILEIISESDCKNKIVILDCCFSGKFGELSFIGDSTLLPCGTTILTACNSREFSYVGEEYSVFSGLLISALSGGASDLLGRVTPGAIYSYIDSSLGPFEQRPLFKSHVSSFVPIRFSEPKMTVAEIRNLAELFETPNTKFSLDPSFEKTNHKGSKEIGEIDLRKPYYVEENGVKFGLLQKAVSVGLVRPSHEKHMFYAALNSDSCELTMLGKHYWHMVENKLI